MMVPRAAMEERMGRVPVRAFRKTALFTVSLFLFILAIMLMKEGARGLEPLVRDVFSVNNPLNALGFGWLFAYVVMSGSPVAAAALTLLDAGVFDDVCAFTMVAGSRMGASFFVLLIGFVYVLRGRDRESSLGMGLLAFIVTGFIHILALPIGVLLLQADMLNRKQSVRSAGPASVLDLLFEPIVNLVAAKAPYWLLFPIGLVIILISFSLFDRCLPHITVGEGHAGRMSQLVFRPFIMFVMGALVTLMTLSVSVSLSILVPLSHRGYVRRENAVPYIMGAGVTTFVDTLLASMLLGNPSALAVVAAQMLSVSLVSIAVLVLLFSGFERTVLRAVEWAAASSLNLALFVLSMACIPIGLLLL